MKAIKTLLVAVLAFAAFAGYRIYRINTDAESVQPPSEWQLLSDEYEDCRTFARKLESKPYSEYTARDTARIEQCLAIRDRMATIRRPK